MLPIIRDLVLIVTGVVGVYVLFSITYCLWLLEAAWLSNIFRRTPPSVFAPVTRFRLLIPSHNEELVIEQTLRSIGLLNYPATLLKTLVIADNCTDRTAEIASSFEFVNVLARTNADQRGKGYALNWALEHLRLDPEWDAIVVVDADTYVDSEFLTAMDSFRTKQKNGKFVAQGRYAVLNAEESWRTALLAGALSLVHVLRPTARQMYGFTVGLKGNGMCFDRAAIERVPWRGDSLTEDIEQALDLLEKEDIKVQFVPSAKVAALMPATAQGSSSQRERWENGRSQIVQRRALHLLVQGLLRFQPAYIDAAIDLLIPPLAEMAAGLFGWIALILLYALVGGHANLLIYLAIYGIVGLSIYIVLGFVVAGAPKMAYKSLLYAPLYTGWKILLRLKKPAGDTKQWVRTSREGDESSGEQDRDRKSEAGEN